MTKHTERPWLVEDDYIVNDDGVTICRLQLAPGDDIGEQTSTNANAQLISAAPELLEAAKDSLQYVRDNNYLDHGNPNHPSPLAEELQQAIEKAERGRNE